MSEFRDKTIVFGITGSIAAYKALALVKQLKAAGAKVSVIPTLHAVNLLDVKDIEQASGNPPHTSLFIPGVNYREYLKNNRSIEHISLSDTADIVVVCPATANILAKVAHGIADDLLTSTILATQVPVIFCPAMNVKMWKNPATQNNISQLKKYGYYVVEPEYGELACGYKGVGRLASLQTIHAYIQTVLSAHTQLKGKKVVVTAGGTSEPIDAVRMITNKASGKMGIALADTANMFGAETVLIKGHTTAVTQRHYKEIESFTVEDMRQAIAQEIPTADIIFHTAAVSDFGLEKPYTGKLKSNQSVSLELTPRTKILHHLRKLNPNTFIVGFKAESNVSQTDLIDSAFKTLTESQADLIVANDVGKPDRGFNTDTNEVFIVDAKKKVIHIPLQSKTNVARVIIENVIKRIT